MSDDPYQHPVLYDLEYEDHREDVPWYLCHADAMPGAVLELGCGTGRLTLELARAGHEVVGVDQSSHMLARMEERLAAEPDEVRSRVQLVKGDFTSVDLGRTFSLVMLPFNAVHHCRTTSEVLDLLNVVKRHMSENSRFVLDMYLPDPQLYARDPARRYEERWFNHPETGEELFSWEQAQYDVLNQIHRVTYVYQYQNGHRDAVHLALRMFYPAEWRGLIDLAGFDVVNEAQDFAGTPLTQRALKWVMVLARR